MTVLSEIGLFLDILGAVLIAVPDASFLSNYSTAGLLAEARERMAIYDGVYENDPGFQELMSILEELEPIATFGSENNDCGDQYVAIVANKLRGMKAHEAAKHEDFEWGNPYIQAQYVAEEDDMDWDKADYYDVGEVYDALRGRIEPKTTNLRFYGLTILTTGFLFQFMSALKAPIWVSGFATLAIWLSAFYLLRG